MPPNRSVDVVVVGGGPAGLVTAALLARRGRAVVVVERSRYEAPRPGESFGAEVRPLLETVGAWRDVADDAGLVLPFRGVHSLWGSDAPFATSSIANPHGDGVHVDRARFDARLATFAERAGATVLRGTRTRAVTRIGDGHRVELAGGDAVQARFFVDASGRGAPASTSIAGHRWLAVDRQVAVIAHGPSQPGVVDATELLVEASEDGWWYSAPQPDGSLVVALITDGDLVPAGGRASLPSRFAAALARTGPTRARAARVGTDGLRVVRADSGRLLPDRAPGFRAVGDAAMSWDPLAGNGVARALAAALDAAPAIDAALDGKPDAPAPGPDPFVEYLERRAAYYLREGRWPDAPFWARRRPLDPRAATITLAPTTMLRRAATTPSVATLAPVEALVPPRAIQRVLAALDAPAPAHAAMQVLRAAAPLGDRRLLVGLQLLVERGAIALV